MPDFNLKQYSRNETIFEEGQVGTVAYILKHGQVEISVKVNKKKVVIHKLEPVTTFGEMALLLEDHRRTASAIALEFSELIEVKKKVFDDYINQSQKFIATTLKGIVERLQKTTMLINKPPDTFLTICEMLNLIASHGVEKIRYIEFIKAVSNTLQTSPQKVKDSIELM